MRAPARHLVAALAAALVGCGGQGDPKLADADLDGVLAADDCDDQDGKVWRVEWLFPDADRDGMGARERVPVCTGWQVPFGYVDLGGDCDDADPLATLGVTAFVDADGDGAGAGEAVEVCARGAGALPAGYELSGSDCDDADPTRWWTTALHADADGDGVGAGDPTPVCIGEVTPEGWTHLSGDCDADDASRWQQLPYLYRDADLDRVTVPQEGIVCSGASLPDGFLDGYNGIDCHDGDVTRWLHVEGYADVDGDGWGSGQRVTLCTNGALPPGYAEVGGDCAPDDGTAWQVLSYAHVDGDRDGATIPMAGSVCAGWALPAGYATAPHGLDCDDGDPAASIALAGYHDDDADGVGAGDAVSFCTAGALPAGHVDVAGDCAPDDPSAWRAWAYVCRDSDGDGRTVVSSGTLCIGEASPPGYLTTPGAPDCDDANAAIHTTVTAYLDADGDGAGVGDPVASCTDGTPPSGYGATAGDCAPADPLAWRVLAYAHVDRDGDGFTRPEAGQVCAGVMLPGAYRAAATGNDCDDDDLDRWRWVVLYRDRDGDGVGAPPREIHCLGTELTAGYSIFGWDPDDHDPAVSEDAATFTTVRVF